MQTKAIRLILFFFFGFVLGGLPVLALAQSTYPAQLVFYVNGVNHTSPDAACQSLFTTWKAKSYPTSPWYYNGNYADGLNRYTCAYGTPTDSRQLPFGVAQGRYECLNGGTFSGDSSTGGVCTKTCPVGQELQSDGQCLAACPDGQTRNANGTCEAPCPAIGTPYGSGLYDIGTDPSAGMQKIGCTPQGCPIMIADGTSPVASAIVNGITRYYGRGSYDYIGGKCDPGIDPGLPAPLSDVPQDSCGATQGKATMNGKTICVDDKGNPVDTKAPTTSTKTTETTSEKTNSDGSTETSAEKTTSTTTCTGDKCTTTTTKTTGGGAGGGGTSITTTTTESKGDFCAKNPNDKQCNSGTDSEGEDDEIKPGDPAKTDELYSSGERTITDAFNEFTAKVKSAPFYEAASGFFKLNVPGGSCSGLSKTIDFMGKSVTVDLSDVFCGSESSVVYGVLSIGLLMAASWIAFRIAFL